LKDISRMQRHQHVGQDICKKTNTLWPTAPAEMAAQQERRAKAANMHASDYEIQEMAAQQERRAKAARQRQHAKPQHKNGLNGSATDANGLNGSARDEIATTPNATTGVDGASQGENVQETNRGELPSLLPDGAEVCLPRQISHVFVFAPSNI
jgi:hypothetical protein